MTTHEHAAAPARGAPGAVGGTGSSCRQRHPAAPETALLQHDFPVSHAVFALARTHRALAASHLAHLGLFPGQEILLLQLGAVDALSQKTIARTQQVDHSTVAKSVMRLERAGLVRRRRSEVDGRITLVELTDAGRAVQEEIVAAWARLDVATTSHLTGAEREEFLALAAKIADGLEAAQAGDRDPGG